VQFLLEKKIEIFIRKSYILSNDIFLSIYENKYL